MFKINLSTSFVISIYFMLFLYLKLQLFSILYIFNISVCLERINWIYMISNGNNCFGLSIFSFSLTFWNVLKKKIKAPKFECTKTSIEPLLY